MEIIRSNELAKAENKEYKISGYLKYLRELKDKKNNSLAFGTLQDSEGNIDLVFFAKVFNECRELLKLNELLTLCGSIDLESNSNKKSFKVSGMAKYKNLTDEEINNYKEMLELPEIKFPHYEHLIIDNKIVYNYIGEELLSNEIFMTNVYFKHTYNIKLEISNYGRIKINNNFIIPTVDEKSVFKHGLSIYINNDWKEKSIHRLVMETFNPIYEMEKKRSGNFTLYEVHHLNNNANDNNLKNLIWVSYDDHRKIDNDFKKELFKRINEINKSKSNFT